MTSGGAARGPPGPPRAARRQRPPRAGSRAMDRSMARGARQPVARYRYDARSPHLVVVPGHLPAARRFEPGEVTCPTEPS